MNAPSRRRRSIMVVRPTVSGIDERSAVALRDAVRGAGVADIGVAYLDIATPTIHDELDRAVADGLDEVLLIPVALPRDRYLVTWMTRGVAHWRESRPQAPLQVRWAEPSGIVEAVAADIRATIDTVGDEVTASPAAYRSPAWSVIEEHDRHVLVCKGPRCMAYGAGPLHRELTALSKQTSTKVTGTGCLSPCNLGPLAIINPGGRWYGHLQPDDARELIEGPGPGARLLDGGVHRRG